MPLNGYLGFLISPTQFHRNEFVGSFAHLAAGLIPLLIGLVLIVRDSDQRLLLPLGALFGLGIGIIFSSLTIVQGDDPTASFGFLALVASTLLLSIAIRIAMNLSGMARKRSER